MLIGVEVLAGGVVVLGSGAVVGVGVVIAGMIPIRPNGALVAATVAVAVAIWTVGGTLVVAMGDSNCAAADWVWVYPAA